MGAHKKYAAKGLVIISMHKGPGSAGEIGRVARLKKWTFPVYNDGTVENYNLQGNPQVFLFDHTGKAVFTPKDGADVESKLMTVAAQSPDWVLGDRSLKSLVGEAKSISGRKNLGSVLTGLEEKAEKAEGEEKEEAQYLVNRLTWYAGRLSAKAKSLAEGGYPSASLATLKELGSVFRGHDIGKKADAESKELMADQGFKKELGAERDAKAVEDAYFKIQPMREGEDEKKWEGRYGRFLKTIKSKLASMEKKAGDTKVYQRVRNLVSDLKLD